MEKTWNDAADRWLRLREKEEWHKQYMGYITRMNALKDAHGHHILNGKPVSQIDKATISDLKELLSVDKKPATVNRYLTIVRSILIMCRDEWGWVDNPPKVKLLDEGPRRERYLKKDEARRLLDELSPLIRDKATVALTLGLRDRNLREMEWSEIDFERKLLSIPANKMKAERPLVIPIHPTALEVLKRRYKAKDRDPRWVFAYAGKPVYRSGTRAFRKALARAGIKNFRWHDLRHTWASWMIQSRTPLSELRELGGWRSDEMVKRYAHLNPEHLRKAVVNADLI